MKVTSFFCGAGGFDLGFIQAGFEVVQAFDFNEYAVQSYRHNIGDHVRQADVSKMTGADLKQSDIWLFGFPCQDLTKNGNMAGLTGGKRSVMFFEIMRLLDEVEHKPKMLLVENVRGLDKFFHILEKEYDKRDYLMEKVLYNSKFWGVPQNRERYFVAGVHKDIDHKFEFPVQGDEITVKLKDILEDGIEDRYDSPIFSIVDGELRVRQATKLGYDIAAPFDAVNFHYPNSKTRRGRVGKQIAQTILTACEQVVVLPDLTYRKFTPREYARINGFPDTFDQVVSDAQFYKQIGNAVTVPVAYEIAKQIKTFLTNS